MGEAYLMGQINDMIQAGQTSQDALSVLFGTSAGICR